MKFASDMEMKPLRQRNVRAATRSLWCLLLLAGASACSLVIKDPAVLLGSPKMPPAGTLSRADAIEDVNALMRTLEHVHPDPYRFRSRDLVEVERRSIVDTMPASLSKTDLCLRLSRLLAMLDDGHTEMLCRQLLIRDWKASADATPAATQPLRMFPPYMRLDDQQHLIVGGPHDAPGVQTGDRLLRVNGQDADALLATWAREVSHDTESGRRDFIARTFRIQLGLHGITAPFGVTVAGPGGNRDVLIKGEPVNYLFGDWPAPAAAGPVASAAAATPVPVKTLETPFFKYRIFEPDVGYMNFTSIFDGFDTEGRFRKAMNRLFERVAADRPRVLIIDIRENGGGEDHASSALLHHITEKPFRLLTSTQVKRSQEVRDLGKSMLRIPFRWLGLQYVVKEGRDYYRGDVGSLSPPDERQLERAARTEPFFAGPVCVLAGPYTFSAAAEFAEAVKFFGLATIVGEDTGGQPNSFGNGLPFPLPRSGLPVNIATASAVRASGNVSDYSSITPDIVVRPTAEDIRKGIDPVIARAANCPSRSIR